VLVGHIFDEAHVLHFDLVLTGIIDHCATMQSLQNHFDGGILGETL